MLLRELIGRVLRRVRRDQGKTLREVGSAVGVSAGHVSEIDRGRMEPSRELATRRPRLEVRCRDFDLAA